MLTGSHTDAIPLSGAYDGTLGVVGGIAAVKALKEAGFRPLRSIEVVMFTSEEPTRFGLSCLGRCISLPSSFSLAPLFLFLCVWLAWMLQCDVFVRLICCAHVLGLLTGQHRTLSA